MNTTRARFSILLILLVLGFPAESAAPRLSALAGDGSALRVEGASAALESAGETRRMALPDDVALSSITPGAVGFWLAGTRLDDGVEGLWLARLDAGGLAEIETPPAAAHRLREPLPLVAGDELLALAWLEGGGERQLAVRAALRDGARWEPSSEVAAPAAGSQLALTGAVLPDGEMVLAWSAFDGEDDEILWSRGDGRAWSAPERLHEANAVPDVTPTLGWVAGPAGGGALTAVWSRFTDDGYALFGARLEAGGWRPTGQIAAPGSVFPSFATAGGETLMVYRRALPRSWVVARVAPGGAALATAVVPDAGLSRPLPLAVETEGARLLPPAPGERVRLVPWERAAEESGRGTRGRS